jgi:hypothetical protein
MELPHNVVNAKSKTHVEWPHPQKYVRLLCNPTDPFKIMLIQQFLLAF